MTAFRATAPVCTVGGGNPGRARERPFLSDVFEWDVATWASSLSLWEEVLPEDGAGLHAIDIGARSGGLSLLLATRGMKVVCSDIRGFVRKAIALHMLYGVADNVVYEVVDATDIPHESNTFDFVVLKSVIGGIFYERKRAGVEAALAEILRVLKPGGYFLFAENVAGSRLHQHLRSRFIKDNTPAAAWVYPSISELTELLSGFEELRYRTAGLCALLGRSERQRRLLARLDACVLPLIPQSLRYMMYGWARGPVDAPDRGHRGPAG